MRKLFGYTWKRDCVCAHLRFNTCTQDKNRQGYRCMIQDEEKCVGHVTLPLPYFDFESLWDPMGLFAYLIKSRVQKCHLRQSVQNLEDKILL